MRLREFCVNQWCFVVLCDDICNGITVGSGASAANVVTAAFGDDKLID